MLTRDDLAGACRANDRLADLGADMSTILNGLSVEPRGALYVAEQRALRQALIYEGWTPEEIMRARKVALGTTEIYMPAFTALWMDGLATGRRAKP